MCCPRVTKAGGVFLIIGAFIAYYIAMSELLASERRAVVRLPLGAWQYISNQTNH
jgi:succinate-acetate transporter protein